MLTNWTESFLAAVFDKGATSDDKEYTLSEEKTKDEVRLAREIVEWNANNFFLMGPHDDNYGLTPEELYYKHKDTPEPVWPESEAEEEGV